MGIAAVVLYIVRANNQIYVPVFLLLAVVEWLRVVAVALGRRKRWAWIVGLGFVPPILFQVWERFYDLGLVAMRDSKDIFCDPIPKGIPEG